MSLGVGGGAGASSYCCAGGGAGGGGVGANGSYPGSNTPWPITAPGAPTPVLRRYQYTSSLCPNSSDAFCVSQWDLLPHSLPAGHTFLEFGQAPQENFTAWSYAGEGGSAHSGGAPGSSGSYVMSASIAELVPFGDGLSAVYSPIHDLTFQASAGNALLGGNGGDGHNAGGGGGGGFFGGGGGGSGIEGAGGGGGSSYFSANLVKESMGLLSAAYMNNSDVLVGTPLFVGSDESSVTISWFFDKNKASAWGPIVSYSIESAEGAYSDDFYLFASVPASPGTSASIISSNYTASGLQPSSIYRFRIVPVFSKGIAMASQPVLVSTQSSAVDYWEQIFPHRLSRDPILRGYVDPVVDRPNIDYPSASNSTDTPHSDPPNADTPTAPSPRRGHSLTLVDDKVLMFGGKTVGYPCADGYKDFVNAMTATPLVDVYPCVSSANEVNELWTLDINTFEWELIHPNSTTTPAPREQHTANVLEGDLFIFGGKSFNYSAESSGEAVFGDFWRLQVQHNSTYTFYGSGAGVNIPDTKPLLLQANNSIDGSNSATSGLCVNDVQVNVTLYHPCAAQLYVAIRGPGPSVGSQNYHPPHSLFDVVLFNQWKTNGTGCVGGPINFIFNDSSLRNTYDCCPQQYNGYYRPDGPLSSFIGVSPFSEWYLVVQDMVADGFNGSLVNWSLSISVAPCRKAYTWSQVSVPGNSLIPPPRFQGSSIAIASSLFLFGGQTANGSTLYDLWRFDLSTSQWIQLVPMKFDSLSATLAYGMSAVLTPIGLLEFGGYSASTLTSLGQTSPQPYSGSLINVDPYTGARTTMASSQSTSSSAPPPPRYLSAAAFIPSNKVGWRTQFPPAAYFNRSQSSTHTNLLGSIIDSVIIFGGDNGATGIVYDGSSGGLLGDTWMFRLANSSAPNGRANTFALSQKVCGWRLRSPFGKSSLFGSCFGNATSSCDFNTLLIAAWCLGEYQAIH